MCHIAHPAEGKIHVYFHTSVNPETSLSQVILYTVYLSFYTDSVASWLLISLVYGLCELECLFDPFLHIVQVLKTRREGGSGHTSDRVQRGHTVVGNYAQLRWLQKKRFRPTFQEPLLFWL